MFYPRSGPVSHPRGRSNRRCLRLEVRVAWSFALPFTASCFAYPSATRHFIQQFCRETGILLDFLLDEQVWERAAHAFVAYAQRRRQSRAGSPKRLIMDFIVAAHPLLRADRLMTLDAIRYRQDFPKLRLL